MKNTVILAALGVSLIQVSEGVILIDITENSGNLDVRVHGNIDTAALGAGIGIVGGSSAVYSNVDILTGPGFEDQGLVFFTTPSSGAFLGPTGNFTVDSSSGTTFSDYFEWSSSLGALVIGNTLQGGGSIDATLTDIGGSFVLNGFTDGDVSTATFTNGANSDDITFRVGSAVPEPSSALLLGIGTFGLVLRRRNSNE